MRKESIYAFAWNVLKRGSISPCFSRTGSGCDVPDEEDCLVSISSST